MSQRKRDLVSYEQKCVICKAVATVSPSWHAHNPYICKSKICVNVYRQLPDSIKLQFKAKDGWRDSSSLYYSEEEDILDLAIYKAIIDESLCKQYPDTQEETKFDQGLWEDYGDWIIKNGEFIILEPSSNCGNKGDSAYVRIVLLETILPKIEHRHIENEIKKLIELERTISLSNEIKRICLANNIDTYFCPGLPYQGPHRITI